VFCVAPSTYESSGQTYSPCEINGTMAAAFAKGEQHEACRLTSFDRRLILRSRCYRFMEDRLLVRCRPDPVVGMGVALQRQLNSTRTPVSCAEAGRCISYSVRSVQRPWSVLTALTAV
jgi:hypothetical protein